MSKTLVAGGAGFLGSHLCDKLISEGHQVLCLDNLLTGKIENIEHLEQNKKFAFLKRNIDETTRTFHDYDNILNFASPASPKYYQRYPIKTMLTNAIGTYNLLEKARKNNAKFLLASTSEIYGDPKENPQKESYYGNVNPNGKRSMYDESKRFAEALTMSYHRKYDVDVSIARIFNTYGPRMRTDDGRALPNFMKQAIKGEDLTVYGDGTQTRSFCYVGDLIDGIYKLLKTDIEGVKPVFNIGNPDEISIKKFASEISKLVDSDSTISYPKSLPEDDPKVRKPDITKAKKYLGWEPKIDREEGLKKSLSYFKRVIE